jgi:hypothetical protein
MKISIFWKKAVFFVFVLMVFVFSIMQLDLEVKSAGSCCTYGNECTQSANSNIEILCCVPYNQQRPCSSSKPNYCKRVCGANPE